MRRVFIYRSPGDAGEGGGGGQGTSLTDIANDLEAGEFGKVNPEPPNLEEVAARQKAADDAAAAEAAAKAKGDAGGDPPADEEPELDEDGNPIVKEKEDDEESQDPKLDKDGNPIEDEPGDDEIEEAEAYWQEVAKYAPVEGVKLEKGLDPETTAKNIQAIVESNMVGFENHLKQTMPDAYRYFIHVQNGGDRESFFNNEPALPPAEDVLKGDAAAAERVVRSYYANQKLDQSDIDAIVGQLKTDDKLVSKALVVRKEMENQIQAKLDADIKASEKREADLLKAKDTFIKKVDKIVEKGQVGNFVIPEKDRKEFAAFFSGRVVPTADGKFIVNYELNSEDLEVELQKEFLRFKKGNLKDIIVKEAKSQNVRELRLRVNGENLAGKSKKGNGGGSSPLPLHEVFN